MDAVLRAAESSDFSAMRRIAAAGGSPDGDDEYFRFVSASGRLMVLESGGVVRGFAGAVPVGEVVMVSDLFVAPAHRDGGVGRRVLDAVLEGSRQRMTFSSTHPAALRLYATFGMGAGPRLLTMRGTAAGGGTAPSAAVWRHTRPELVAYLAALGATVYDDAVVDVGPDLATILRVESDDPMRTLERVLCGLPAGLAVELSVLETHPVVAGLDAMGFGVVDHDICCTSVGVSLPARVCCVHRGLC